MKNFYKILSLCCFLLFFLISCGKLIENDKNVLAESNQFFNGIEKSQAGMMQGIHYMGVTLAGNCFLSKEITYPKNIEKIVVSYVDDLREQELRKKLNITSDIHLPGELLNVNAGINYAKNAAINKLSRSTTYHAYVYFGESKIDTSTENTLILRKSYEHFFNLAGELIDPFNFIKKCGDEIVTSQIYSSKLMVTIKLNFDSVKALKEFNTNIGGVLNAFILEGVDVGPTVKLSKLKESTRRQIKLELHGIQIGGQPEEMMRVISSHNSCRLDNLNDCYLIFQKLNKYISEDYRNQLNENDIYTWSVESSKTTSYDKLNIQNSQFKTLKFNWANNMQDSIRLSMLKSQLSTRIAREYSNYALASSAVNSKDLGVNEKKEFDEIMRKSKRNINVLRNYSTLCYTNINDCLNKVEINFEEYLEKYDENCLKSDPGFLISKIRSDSKASEGQKNRSSLDFLTLQTVFEEKKYSSIFFKVKTIDNHSIQDKNLRFNLMCNKSWYRGRDPVLITGAFNEYEITSETFQLNYEKLCANDEMIYVATPKNVNYPDFIVEVWGRE